MSYCRSCHSSSGKQQTDKLFLLSLRWQQLERQQRQLDRHAAGALHREGSMGAFSAPRTDQAICFRAKHSGMFRHNSTVAPLWLWPDEPTGWPAYPV